MSSVTLLKPESLAILQAYQNYKSGNTQTTNTNEQKKQSNIPQGPPPSSTFYPQFPLGNAPGQIANSKVITISKANLDRSNALRATMGLEPLDKIANLDVVTTTTIPGSRVYRDTGQPVTTKNEPIHDPTNISLDKSVNGFSAGTNDFRNSQINIITKLQEAKNAGITSLDLLDSKGNKIGTVNPQDVARARYDILKASIDRGGEEIQAVGSKTIPGVESTITTYERKENNPLKETLANIVEPLAYTGLAFMKLPDAISEIAKGKNPYEVGKSIEQSNIEQIQKSIGTTYLDKIMAGNFNPSELTTGEKIGGLVGTGIGFYLLGGGGGKDVIKSLVSKPISIIRTQNTINKISTALNKANNNLVTRTTAVNPKLIGGVEPTKPTWLTRLTEKINPSKIQEVSTGTVGKSGIESFVPERGPVQVERLPSGKVQAVKPELAPYINEITDVTGIGRHGEKITISRPTEIKLNPDLEGIAQLPQSIINTEGLTSIVRSEPQNELPVGGILMEHISPGKAVHYGLEEVIGQPGTYFGKATSHLLEKLSEDIKKGTIKVGTDIFQYPTKDIAKNPTRYVEATTNPEILKNGNLPSLVRPRIIRYLIGNEPGGYPLKSIGKTATRPSKPSRPFTASDFQIGPGHVAAGSAGRAANLLKKIEISLPKIVTHTETKEKTTDYLGLGSTNIRQETRKGRVRYTTEYETYAIPGTNLRVGNRNLLTRIKVNAKLENVGRTSTDTISRISNQLKEGTKVKQKSKEITIPKIMIIHIPDVTHKTTQIVTPIITTKLIQKVRQREDTIPTNIQITTTQRIRQKYFDLGGGIPVITFPSLPGNEKKKKGRGRGSFFIYSVNPSRAGAIAQEGIAGKSVGYTTDVFKNLEDLLNNPTGKRKKV
jgi:hypothetical protein